MFSPGMDAATAANNASRAADAVKKGDEVQAALFGTAAGATAGHFVAHVLLGATCTVCGPVVVTGAVIGGLFCWLAASDDK